MNSVVAKFLSAFVYYITFRRKTYLEKEKQLWKNVQLHVDVYNFVVGRNNIDGICQTRKVVISMNWLKFTLALETGALFNLLYKRILYARNLMN